jgi:trehalose 6-phosphate phosphatase
MLQCGKNGGTRPAFARCGLMPLSRTGPVAAPFARLRTERHRGSNKTTMSDTDTIPANGPGIQAGDDVQDLPLPPPLATVDRAALFLDFDGTLVELADHPDAVIVAPTLQPLISSLAHRLDGRRDRRA